MSPMRATAFLVVLVVVFGLGATLTPTRVESQEPTSWPLRVEAVTSPAAPGGAQPQLSVSGRGVLGRHILGPGPSTRSPALPRQARLLVGSFQKHAARERLEHVDAVLQQDVIV